MGGTFVLSNLEALGLMPYNNNNHIVWYYVVLWAIVWYYVVLCGVVWLMPI